MAIEATGEAFALVTEIRHLMHRADEALRISHRIGSLGLSELVAPLQRLHAALESEVPKLELLVAERNG